MKKQVLIFTAFLTLVAGIARSQNIKPSGSWVKYSGNPVLGGTFGTIFDVSVLKTADGYLMYSSWRPKKSIAISESKDGFHWSDPEIVLSPDSTSGWENDLNRPVVVKRPDGYHMWYTGQISTGGIEGISKIGYATSKDGRNWKRVRAKPVLTPEQPWEKTAVMCPHVLWDNEAKHYKMWYSGGEQYEPDAIGYATSKDGINWKKHIANPVFANDPANPWEQAKVTACQVIKIDKAYYMFYIGFKNIDYAQIGIAKSANGITNWERYSGNPIISPGSGWDASAVYKPFAIYDGKQWLLWYNGRKEGKEQIGVAIHQGKDFFSSGFTRQPPVLSADQFKPYISQFNKNDKELYTGAISNKHSWDFLKTNIPILDCPDKAIEKTYYFRWWTYRKHIKKTADGYVITEFLPNVPWAGKDNAISCPAAFHFYEGRWLHDQKYLNSYADYWFHRGGSPRSYSFWPADAIYNYHLVTGTDSLMKALLPDLIKNYESWEKEKLDANGLFWQIDDRDGMEVSACGTGYRATINSYMYGECSAIANIASTLADQETARKFREKANRVKQAVQEKLWDKNAEFFKMLPREPGAALCKSRELYGYTPWYFNLPDKEYSGAWKFLMNPQHFYAPFGPTTLEQNDPGFKLSYEGHECQWNGPSWPFATSLTLTALANLLDNYKQSAISKTDYYKLLKIYTNSQQLKSENGNILPWIDENLNPLNGDWISRTRLRTWKNGTWSTEKGGIERGKDYNHSTYSDLIISGLIGIRPQSGNRFILKPLVPQSWNYFCLDNIPYHGKIITVLYDKTGTRYKKGKGLKILVNGKTVASSKTLSNMECVI